MLAPLMHGNLSRWSTACDEVTVNIVGFWIMEAPRFASDDTFLGYIGSCIDITERKQAQDRFRLVVEASPNGIVLVNAQGHIVLVNACAEKLFGYEREELIGQHIELLVPERFRGESLAHRAGFHAATAARAMGAGRELFARRKDGTEFPVEIGSSPIQSPEGTLVLSVIVDISVRKQAEAETRQHREELAHLSRVAIMGEMAGSLAHELNQPLTGIVNNASAARRFLNAITLAASSFAKSLISPRTGRRAGDVIRGVRAWCVKERSSAAPCNLTKSSPRCSGCPLGCARPRLHGIDRAPSGTAKGRGEFGATSGGVSQPDPECL